MPLSLHRLARFYDAAWRNEGSNFGAYDWRQEDFGFANYLCLSRDHPELRRLLEG